MARPLRDDDVVALAAAAPLALLLDVDGTLAPIAPRPEAASVPEETRRVVQRLVRRPDTVVALVSGRAAADARRLVGVDGLWVVGNHGAERVTPDGREDIDAAVAAHEAALARAADTLTRLIGGVEGVLVEFKRWSVAVHYRLAARAEVPGVERTVREVGAREGLRVAAGKELLELRAPVAVDKGTAILDLLARVGVLGRPDGGAMFVGDDVTDEDAFRRLRAELPAALTVRVGPADVDTAAAVVVADPAAVRALLEQLADAHGGAPAAAGAPPQR